jgi:hypothetical protein
MDITWSHALMAFKSRERRLEYYRTRYATLDKAKIMANRRAYYERNKEKIIARTKAWTIARMERLREIVMLEKDNPCMDCNKRYHFSVMDFDHREGEIKNSGISALMNNWKVGETGLRKELAKCDLVCSNCHRVRTYNRLMARLERQRDIIEVAQGLQEPLSI